MTTRQISRRDFLKLLGGASGAAILARCAPAPAATTEAPAATEAAPAGFSGTLEYWDWAHPSLRDHGKELIAAYTSAHPEVKLTQTTLEWGDYQTKAMAAAAAKSGPDLSATHQIWKWDMIRGGYLEPFPDDFTDWDKKFSTPFNRVPDTGKIYNFAIGNVTDVVFVNTELLEANGVKIEDIPAKWEDFMKLAQQLTKRDSSGAFTQVGCGFNDPYVRGIMYYSLIYQQGGWAYGEDRASALWNEEAGLGALQFLQDWYHKHQVEDPTGLIGADAFGNEQTPLFLTGAYYAGAFDSRYPQIAGKWAAVPTPTFTGTGLPAWGFLQPEDGFCVSAFASPEKKEAAFAYLKETSAGPEGERGWYQAMAESPDHKDLANDDFIETTSNLKAQAITLPYRVNLAEVPSEADKFLQEMFDEVILNKGDIKAAADKAVEQMNETFKATSDKKRYILERLYTPPSS
jgi:multiple sugar transport system substrate-binding protein